MRLQVLTVTSMKMRVFWDTEPCSLEVNRRLRGANRLYQVDDGGSTHF
jgi:hypothetical protein